MRKFLIILLLSFLPIFAIANSEERYKEKLRIYVDTQIEFIIKLDDVADKTVNVNVYIPATDSALLISEGSVVFKSNTLELGKTIQVFDILNCLYSDTLFIDDKSVVIF